MSRVVFLSSIAALGVRTSGTPLRPDSPPAPVNDYGQSKLAGEKALEAACRASGMELVIVRPPLVYGHDAPGNFGKLLHAARRGIPLPLRSIRNRRDFVGLMNLCDLLLLTTTHPAAAGKSFLATDGETTSTGAFAGLLYDAAGHGRKLLPCPPAFLRTAARLLDRAELADRLLDDLELDGSEARVLLGWQPPLTLKGGIAAALGGGHA